MSALTKGMGMIRRTAVLALLVLPLAFLATTGAHAAARKTPDGKVTRASGRCGSCHPDERVAFVLRYVEGMDLGQVAETCRVSLSTIKRRLARAEGRFARAAKRDEVLTTWLEEGGRWTT